MPEASVRLRPRRDFVDVPCAIDEEKGTQGEGCLWVASVQAHPYVRLTLSVMHERCSLHVVA
jgi:hypothetical protein